jgi:glucose/arabinose dehydrogenase
MRGKFKAAMAAGLAAALLAPMAQAQDQGQAPAANETRAPNGKGQAPVFAGQTRAPVDAKGVAYKATPWAKGLDHPWALAFLPDGRALVTERPGRLRYVAKDGALSEPISGVPAVVAKQQGGLLDVALDPKFAANHRIYLTYLEPRDGDGSGISIARAELAGQALSNLKVIFRAEPAQADPKNMGSRLVFAPDGTLFASIGDRFESKDQAQALDSDLGKIIHIDTEGRPAKGNPFIGKAGAKPEIWSYGHRNPEALALNPRTGALWDVEHGAKGGDEINVALKGKNYGWPVITYGIDYSGAPIGDGITQKAGMEQPLYYWDPVIAPSGMMFYTGDKFPAWKGSLFVGGLQAQAVVRLTLNGDKVVGEERLLKEKNIFTRIRDVRQGPDGLIYVLNDSTTGVIYRLSPQ